MFNYLRNRSKVVDRTLPDAEKSTRNVRFD